MSLTLDRAFAAATLAMGAAIYWSAAHADWAQAAGLFGVGPATWPKGIAIGLIVLSALQLGASFVRPGSADRDAHSTSDQAAAPAGWVVGLIALMAAFYPLLVYLGYYVGTGLAMAVLARIMGERRALPIVVLLVCVLGGSYLLFEALLGISLPRPRWM